jgi:hypothetical protein
MKNLKKLTKPKLKRINGGNAPECDNGLACYYPPKDGHPGFWRCLPVTVECP